MPGDVTLIRGLAERVHQWPGASGEVRRLSSVLWHDVADPDGADLSGMIARLTGEMRRCRYTRDPGMAAAFDRLRREVAALDDSGRPWLKSAHDVFAIRTRAACRDAGLDL